jgi:hypothetical protein
MYCSQLAVTVDKQLLINEAPVVKLWNQIAKFTNVHFSMLLPVLAIAPSRPNVCQNRMT